jgi:hypothetical protein
MKKIEFHVLDKNGFDLYDPLKLNLGDNEFSSVLIINGKSYYFDDNGNQQEGFQNVYVVMYRNPLVGDKGEALHYTCKAYSDKDAISKAMLVPEFIGKIFLKHFDKKFLSAHIPVVYDKNNLNTVEYFEGDPRL